MKRTLVIHGWSVVLWFVGVLVIASAAVAYNVPWYVKYPVYIGYGFVFPYLFSMYHWQTEGER